ncbi:MAG: bifunctional DNA-formamidopyrimidine glycosylase/DNA-(apurinic or apyrimidinic site) lyase [candidate division WOR-3 bacterium]|nr:MAG: bifunctional DNA-formamidopyrimidine glycosylase/DNA-(apurinic or apyrimidinic site) lyase [candidate division WOR-3 bacterium]
MPELPEVETIKRELRGKIRGQRIVGCSIQREDIIAHPSAAAFCPSITGEQIIDVKRNAKYLILQLSNNKRLMFHLRLSGTIVVSPPNATPERFTRLAIQLSDYRLFFKEPRALGRVYLIDGNEVVPNLKGFYRLGCEPISDGFTFDYLKAKLKRRKARIKSLLLDQNICAGMGNIYSDEALFRAGIRPMRRANRITDKEIQKLQRMLKDVITDGIANFGTSVSDYKRTDGKEGSFQKVLHVYGREGEPCRKCGSKIVLKKIGNRGTRYCPKCQT